MLYYGIMTFCSVAACWWATKLKDKLKVLDGREADRCRRMMAFALLLSFLPMFLISAFRWNVGTDTWHTYTPEYLAMKAERTELTVEEKDIILKCGKLNAKWDLGYTDEEIEQLTYNGCLIAFQNNSKHTAFGFQALEKLLILFGADVQWLYAVTSLFILLFVFLAIWKQSSMPPLALLLFVLTSNFFLALNIVAQFMAISVCLFACTYAEKRKPVFFFVLVLFAACFHFSALVFLPVYFLPKLKIKPVWCAVVIGAVMLIAQVAYPLIVKAVELLAPRYAHYLSGSADFEWIFFAIGLAVFVVGTYYYPKGKDLPYYRLWYYANIIGLIVLCFSGRIPSMKRINYYFAAPHFLFLPLVIQCEEKPLWRKLLCAAVVVLFLAETVVAVGYMNKNGVLPYQTMIGADRPAMTNELMMLLLK